jgi:hypothetical protein
VQDRIVCEMLLRERKRQVASANYLGRILASGFMIPEKLHTLWTTLFSMEVFQESYAPHSVQDKKQAVELMKKVEKEKEQGTTRAFRKLNALTVEEGALQPATPQELEEVRRRLRARRLRAFTGK